MSELERINEEACDAFLQEGVRCELKKGHEGNHSVEVPIPMSLARLIAEQMDDLDRKRALFDRLIRINRRSIWWMLGALATNIAAAIYNLIGGLTS